MLTVGSLFSGIGGLDLGLERAGMRVLWQCESDSYCRAVLRKHWPAVPCHEDVRSLADGVQPVDVLCGGFPCQPVSLAGRRRGAADERWLWPEFARLIRVLRPRYALMENVPGLLVGGGMAEVLRDLAESGYDAEWDCIPAAAVGAPHLRYRVFIVAYASRLQPGRSEQRPERERAGLGGQPMADSEGHAGELRESSSERQGRPASSSALADATDGRGQWRGFDPGPADGRRSLGLLARPDQRGGGQWLTEPDVGRVAHGVPSRVDRLRALGNAVVPQVAEYVGRQIVTAHNKQAITASTAPKAGRQS